MKNSTPFENAIDLLDADHKAVKQLFIEYKALSEGGSSGAARKIIAEEICRSLAVHSQIEEEIFYPAVRRATGDDALLEDAIAEHAEAKQLIAKIQDAPADANGRDALVEQLATAIDEHVLEEREQIFMKAQQAALDLRGLAVTLYERKQQLTASTRKRARPAKEPA